MRSQAKAPSAGSVWTAAAAFALTLLALAFAAPAASAHVTFVVTEGATEVQKHSAALNGFFGNDGPEAHYLFEWGETEAYGNTTPAPPGDALSGGFQTVPPITIGGLAAGTTYHYRLKVRDLDSAPGEYVSGGDATFTTGPPVDNLSADAATAITGTTAELNASFDGDGTSETHYYFEWGPSTAYGNTTPVPPGAGVPAGTGRIHVPPVTISGLESGATYHYRVVASNPEGIARSADASFKTAEAPIVANVRSAGVTVSSAELLGDINPHLGDTTYKFEWGPTASYGNSTPAPAGEVAAGSSSVPVKVQVGGLSAGVTYHFRLVATNQYGTTASPDQTFGFYPPNCPNSQLRQETRANDLPDCRAYELVTPSFAQGAVVMPASGPTSGLATNPPRISYAVNFGLFDESTGEAPNSISDLFVSTRSDSGWSQRYIGRPTKEGIFMGGPLGAVVFSPSVILSPGEIQRGTQATPSLDRILNYNWSYPGQISWISVGSNGPYIWNGSTGALLERWPTNLAQTPGGEHFVGMPQASPDFSHFVFSSNVVFAPGGEPSGGEIECCLPPVPTAQMWPRESVYDNDVSTGTVVLASVKADGTPFKGRVFDISEDGSHILMTEEAVFQGNANTPPVTKELIAGAAITGPLYLRVDANRTYEIAPGRQIEYAGSTADGKTVYITSTEQLTPDDHDSSRDLFVWHQSESNALTRVSVGSGGTRGDTDSCTPSEGWTTGCSVAVIDFDAPRDPAGAGGNGYTDNYLASGSGDIYFESPELLVGQRGEAGERNLYLYREGNVSYVATMRSSRRVNRMQVTPDGRHMAMVTGSNLTDYDSANHLEMYLYGPGDKHLTCVSCRPDSQPPTGDVLASQNGLFLTNDGRAFFSTSDPLVPRDTNRGDDVYEFTEGKAQLITTGIGTPLESFIGGQTAPGLVNVSANGTDVYFATTDNLVTQDHNGAQIKIYDARTGGGFPAEREEPKCEAADECHGASSVAPVLPADRTSASLGSPAKAKSHKAKKHKKARKHKRNHKKQLKKKRAGKTTRKQGGGERGGHRHG